MPEHPVFVACTYRAMYPEQVPHTLGVGDAFKVLPLWDA